MVGRISKEDQEYVRKPQCRRYEFVLGQRHMYQVYILESLMSATDAIMEREEVLNKNKTFVSSGRR